MSSNFCLKMSAIFIWGPVSVLIAASDTKHQTTVRVYLYALL